VGALLIVDISGQGRYCPGCGSDKLAHFKITEFDGLFDDVLSVGSCIVGSVEEFKCSDCGQTHAYTIDGFQQALKTLEKQ
jgi:hypothetical protein